jgi:hypothetical protein
MTTSTFTMFNRQRQLKIITSHHRSCMQHGHGPVSVPWQQDAPSQKTKTNAYVNGYACPQTSQVPTRSHVTWPAERSLSSMPDSGIVDPVEHRQTCSELNPTSSAKIRSDLHHVLKGSGFAQETGNFRHHLISRAALHRDLILTMGTRTQQTRH